MRALGPLAPVLGALCLGIVGCGPSLRRIHLADGYFEHCYAGDRDEEATDPERRACWEAWLESYRDGQSVERIEYAEERVATLDPERAAIFALALTEEMPPDEGYDAAPAEGGTEPAPSTIPGAAPLSPPTSRDPDELHRRHRPLPPRTTTPSCAAACEPAWVACVDACAEGDRACSTACRASLRTCSRGCY